MGKRESSRGERRGRLLGHEYKLEEAGMTRASHCHRELPPVTATAAEGNLWRGTVLPSWLEAALCRQDLTQAPGSGSSRGTTFCPQLQEAASKGQEQDTERAGMEGLGMPWCHGSEHKCRGGRDESGRGEGWKKAPLVWEWEGLQQPRCWEGISVVQQMSLASPPPQTASPLQDKQPGHCTGDLGVPGIAKAHGKGSC